MPHLNSYLTLVALALSTLTSALPQRLSARQTVTVPANVAPGTITSGCVAFHTVGASETCITVEAEFDITDDLFRMLNPQINSACTNLFQGSAYCVQTASTPTTTTTTPSTPTTLSTVAHGTIIAGCTQFFTVPSGDSCPEIETKFNISDALFRQLNPELDTLCSNLVAGQEYCVGTSNSTTTNSTSSATPTIINIAGGTVTQGCTQFFTVQPGDICPTIETMFNITFPFFKALNPEINNQCSNLIAGEAYCVQSSNTTIVTTPANVVTGTMTAGCTTFFTIQSGTTCEAIEQQFNITLPQFIDLNPNLNAECTNLLIGEAYCVQSSSA